MTIKSILKLCKKAIPNLRLSQQKTLSACVQGNIIGGGRTLSDMARGIQSETSHKHNYKRLDRFLSNARVKVDEIGKDLLRFLVSKECGKLFPIYVFMDWTIEDDKHVLMFSLKVGQRSVPFYWYCVDKYKINNDQNRMEDDAIKLIKSWLPKGRRMVIIADRGFHRSGLEELLQSLDLDYIIRIQKSTHIISDVYNGALKYLKLKLNAVKEINECFLGKAAKVPTRMIMKKIKVKTGNKNSLSTWYLSTTLKNYKKEEIISLYERRMGIECTFKDLKTTLHWRHKREIHGPERLSRYLLILVMSLILAWLTATRKNVQHLLNKLTFKKSFGSSNNVSFVQAGLWIIRHLMPRYHVLHHRKVLWDMT